MEPPDRPTVMRLRKLIAIAEDRRGDANVRKVAQAKLALYARFYPGLVREKKPHDPAKN
jgi:hypothetical protein